LIVVNMDKIARNLPCSAFPLFRVQLV